MQEESTLIPAVVAMTRQAALRLLSAGDGEAALFYLALITKGQDFHAARQALSWPDHRAREAYKALISLKLVSDSPPPAELPPQTQSQEPPVYSGADLAQELEQNSTFSGLVKEVQRRLGKVLSTADLQMLYTLYDFLALPAEVILLVVSWCIEEAERKYGAGHKPRMSQIRREAFAWHRLGIDTAERAEAHLKHLSLLQDRQVQILPLLGISGRLPVEGERKYITAWVEMGFSDDAIRLAYEKTILKKQSLSWPYMNSILKSWHQKGLHTAEQVEAGDSAYRRAPGPSNSPRPSSPAGAGHPQDIARLKQDMERMERLLAQAQREEE